jgi:succinate dehydrogenase / fumarate reductase cytochrome b subunit
MFLGPDAYNRYGHALVSNPAIYVAEAALVITILMHFFNGIALTIENRRARPTKYAMAPNGEKAPRFQSRFMVFHGILLAVFIVWHLITFKFGPMYMTTVNGVEMRDLYRLLVEVFQQPFYVAFYAVCMVAVGLHLSHGFYSAFASLGVFHPKWAPTLNRAGIAYAVVVAAGFISQPVYIFLWH